uniref:EF-hand domain (C-terminal) containing 2 n=1 Tax=Salarias fasciatus TaxID=181472 RepID=A0A672IEE7_SALFA
MALPFLPGNSRNTRLGKERFHKSQHFDYTNGFPMLVGSEKPGIGGERLVGQEMKPQCSVGGSEMPAWLAFDKQALCFEAYFQEAVQEVQEGRNRIRKCKIYFYLEDDTIQVVEPEYKNSGIPQGTLICRQRIPLPPPNQERFYNIFHFNINHQVVLFSRTFTVTNCDTFTRDFLRRQGVLLNAPAEAPADPYCSLRQQLEDSMKPLRPYERHDTLRQFLDHDGKVLRFYCLWDDTESAFGERRELVLHYFLSDDTIEILEVVPPNSGRDAPPRFLQRSRLPKKAPVQMKQPGEVTARTVLNVLSSENQGSHYILDNLKTGALQDDFYQDCDLTVGGELNVWGRRVILTDCDDFTKHYYRSKYGIEDFTPVQYKAPPAPKPPRPVPPYNGFGSEEDSLSSCRGLLPKPPRKDFHKFMENDRWDESVLNFLAKMATTDPVDQERLFHVSYHLCDDTISVFERPQKNSGVIGGKFLLRCRVKKPGQDLFKSELSEYFTAPDLYVGATLCLGGRSFRILEADEFTLNYMQQQAVGDLSPDPNNTGSIAYESFSTDLLTGLDCGLSEHEVLVLGRGFWERPQPEPDLGLMLAVAQDLLRKNHFEQFPHLVREFTHQDPEKFADGDEIDYHAFVAGINWTEHPAPPVWPEDVLKHHCRGNAPPEFLNLLFSLENILPLLRFSKCNLNLCVK